MEDGKRRSRNVSPSVIDLSVRYLSCCSANGFRPKEATFAALKEAMLRSHGGREFMELNVQLAGDEDPRAVGQALQDCAPTLPSMSLDARNSHLSGDAGIALLCSLRAVGPKLERVNLSGSHLEREVVRDLFREGLSCAELNLSACRLLKLDLRGCFDQLKVLNLDFNTTLHSISMTSFQAMQNLEVVTLCGTGINNLWTSAAALAPLQGLRQLRFQRCLCCLGTGPCEAEVKGTSMPPLTIETPQLPQEHANGAGSGDEDEEEEADFDDLLSPGSYQSTTTTEDFSFLVDEDTDDTLSNQAAAAGDDVEMANYPGPAALDTAALDTGALNTAALDTGAIPRDHVVAAPILQGYTAAAQAVPSLPVSLTEAMVESPGGAVMVAASLGGASGAAGSRPGGSSEDGSGSREVGPGCAGFTRVPRLVDTAVAVQDEDGADWFPESRRESAGESVVMRSSHVGSSSTRTTGLLSPCSMPPHAPAGSPTSPRWREHGLLLTPRSPRRTRRLHDALASPPCSPLALRRRTIPDGPSISEPHTARVQVPLLTPFPLARYIRGGGDRPGTTQPGAVLDPTYTRGTEGRSGAAPLLAGEGDELGGAADEVSGGLDDGAERMEGIEEVEEGKVVEAGNRVHSAPLCSEKGYREFMVVNLPQLEVLDNLAITKAERERARQVHAELVETLPYRRRAKENVMDILRRREIAGAFGRRLMLGPFNERLPSATPAARPSARVGIQHDVCASLCTGTMRPATRTVHVPRPTAPDSHRRFRPRQFEYHPTIPDLMVFGTLTGEVVVMNHEQDLLVGGVKSMQSLGSSSSILGLCWLNKDPTKLIAGSDNGSIQLYDLNKMRAGLADARQSGPASFSAGSLGWGPDGGVGGNRDPCVYEYERFNQLTSVHINCTDDYFLTSGYSSNVGLYDLRTGKRLQVFQDLHREHINVLKFANHSPHLFVTSSFDHNIKMWDLRQRVTEPLYTASSTRGNVMVCFSPDDHYILASAVDNEVNQLLASDGRLHLKFDIPSVDSTHNYTRSYYMNGRDYIVSGSCEENVVRVMCATTGRRLREVSMESRCLKDSLYVQSLRGDPIRDFHFSVLVAYNHPNPRSEIVKVDLLGKDGRKEKAKRSHRGTQHTGVGA